MTFARDTTVRALGDGRFRATVTADWNVVRGPFGGFVAALLARALCAEAQWPPRTLAVHFVDAPAVGEVEITVRTERAGRSSMTLSLRLEQEGRPMALALATVGARRDEEPAWLHLTPPPIAPLQQCTKIEHREGMPEFMRRLDVRWGEGASLGRPGRAYNAAWVGVGAELDDVALAALSDVWMPPAFGELGRMAIVPTIDLTIHFREAPPGRARHVIAAHRSEHAGGGTWTCDGELWSEDGRLLVQARQLALLRTT